MHRFENARRFALTFAEARHDLLTGLPNHRAFDEHLERVLRGALTAEGEVTLVLLDLDDFKRVNDTHGHPAGDEVLRTFGRTVRRAVRGGEEVFRAGGEEFAIVVRGGAGGRPTGRRARSRGHRVPGRRAAVPDRLGRRRGRSRTTPARRTSSCTRPTSRCTRPSGRARTSSSPTARTSRAPLRAPPQASRATRCTSGWSPRRARTAVLTELSAITQRDRLDHERRRPAGRARARVQAADGAARRDGERDLAPRGRRASLCARSMWPAPYDVDQPASTATCSATIRSRAR